MSNGNGHRWSKFWWCDWQNDKGLQQCSLAARGLWIELLGLCHASEKPGYLLINGEPPDNEALADVLGRTTTKEIAKLLDELERRRIFSREDGVIFSRRMVKDTAVSEQASKWGKRGGNPALNPQGGLTPSLNPEQGNGVNPAPYPPPLNQKLEAEEEAERDPPTPPQAGGSTPASPGTPQAGRRVDGSNSREKGTNPRNRGTNPRTPAHREGGFVSGGIAVLAERLIQIAAAKQPHDDDLTDERSYFAGLKVVEGGRG